VVRDFDGRARSQTTPDPGAFESSGGGGTTNQNPSVSAAPVTASGGSITVTWSGIVNASPTNWIGLYLPGAPSTAHNCNWMYVSCSKTATIARASGSCIFPLPSGLVSGTYELRLHAPSSWTAIARSSAISISGSVASGLTFSLNSATATRGSSITVSWSGIANAAPTNWFGLYLPGAASWAHNGNWMYVSCSKTAVAARVSGSCTFPLPLTLAPGSYQMRLHAPASWAAIATSAPLVVQ
jgi:hypothetical protein